jgi:Reverse transcriptase (RNA-dependent DNA polymerase)
MAGSFDRLSRTELHWIIGLLLLISTVSATKCNFCGKDFKSVNRHSWRCQSRITGSAQPITNSMLQGGQNGSFQGPIAAGIVPHLNDPTAENVGIAQELTTCMCGKQCKGRRGLVAHQRSCRAFHDLLSGPSVKQPQTAGSISSCLSKPQGSLDRSDCPQPSEVTNANQRPSLIPGLKLPRTTSDWTAANAFFHTKYADILSGRSIDIEKDAITFQESIYTYFSKTHGTVNSHDKQFVKKYGDMSVNSLKKTLHSIKREKTNNADEIIFVSKLLRTKLKSRMTKSEVTPSDKQFNTKFWRTCNDWYNHVQGSLPRFSIKVCEQYFKDTLSRLNVNAFLIPSWFVKLNQPSKSMDTSPPTYKEVARAINKARGGASPCPLDQISVLILKRCPILRTVLHKLIVQCWNTGYIPSVWRRAVTVLIYKKGDPTDPANFRPISLQCSLYKIFSSVYRDRLQAFMLINGYYNTGIQKGFVGGVDGVLEHTSLLDFIMRSAKRHQRSLYVALFDLRNAFGEVDHELIRTSLEYHNIPVHMINIFNGIYSDFNVNIACNDELTTSIKVQRGVLQGDPCSPLLFNVCFNSLMKVMDTDNYKKLGYIWGNRKSQSTNWLQYADDAVLIAKDQKGAQGLTNLFEAWCSWANMIIRLDKCSSFGMLKNKSNLVQILPKISINAGPIPTTPIGGNFKYLGRFFNFDMDGEPEKTEMEDKLSNLLKITTDLQVKPQTKLKILDRYIASQLSFMLRVGNFSSTWISQVLDALTVKHVRRWVEAPISSCIAEWLIAPKSKGGLGIPSWKNRFEKLLLSKRSALKNSPNVNIKDLWADTNGKNIISDSSLMINTLKDALKIISKDQKNLAVNHLIGLAYQGLSLKVVTEHLPKKSINQWAQMAELLPGYLYNFVRKAIQSQLPTLANLVRWGKVSSNVCPLCNASQTNKHVLSNCGNPDVLKRYLDRHNKILSLLASWFKSKLNNDYTIFIDLPGSGFRQTHELFVGVRPDMALMKNNEILAIELTICHETNLESSKNYKRDKYKNLSSYKAEIIKNCKILLTTCELSVLGFLQIDSHCLKQFGIPMIDDDTIMNMFKTVIFASFEIYTHRDSPEM